MRAQPAEARVSQTNGPQGTNDVQYMIARYQEDQQSNSKFFNITWSEQRMDRLDALAAAQLEELARVDFGRFDQTAKIDAIAFRNYLRNGRSYGALERARMAEMQPLLPFRLQIVELEESRWKMPDTEALVAEVMKILERKR